MLLSAAKACQRSTSTDTKAQWTHQSVTTSMWLMKKDLCVWLWWKLRRAAAHTHSNLCTHTVAGTNTHPADTSVWPHSHLKRFHSLTVRPAFPPADVFWGQCFFEKTLTASARQEEPTSANFDRVFCRIPKVVFFKHFQAAPLNSFCSEQVFVWS